MIRLITQGQVWDLYPGTKVKFQFNNPAFSEDNQTGSYSLPFRFPATKQNQKIAGFANLSHNTSANYAVFSCDFYINTDHFFSGLLYVTRATSDEFEGDLAIDTGPFSRKLSNFTLRSSEMNHQYYSLDRSGTVEIAQINIMDVPAVPDDQQDYDLYYTLLAKNFNNTDYNFQYYKFNSIEDVTLNIALLVNAQQNTGQISNHPALKMTASQSRLIARRTNSLQSLNMTMRFQYRLTSNPSTVANYDFPFVISTVAILSSRRDYSDFVLGWMYNREFYGDDLANNKEYYSHLNSGSHVDIDTDWAAVPREEFWYNHEGNTNAIVPMFRLSYVFDRLHQITGYGFSGAFLNDAELLNLVLYDTYSADKLDAQGLNIFDSVFGGNHMPKVSLSNFMLGIAKNLGFYYSFGFKSNFCKMIYKKDFLKAAVVDYTRKAVSGYEFDFEAPTNYDLKYEDHNLKGYENFFNTVKAGNFDTSEDYTIQVGTLPYITGSSSDFNFLAIDQLSGNSKEFNQGTGNDYDFRVIFFRPQSGKLSSAAIEPTDNYSLQIDGEKGLYENFHKDWIKFLQTSKPMKKSMLFSLADVLELDMNKRMAINFEVFLISSFEFELENSETQRNVRVDFELMKSA